ncbi:MAG: hypothetical protein ASARMPRED_009182 [Alectoria sarmentosa]|nr:MAG: hypothetical protein ASARMPRED_009182 [Alectoria sarmentosa]
MCIALFSTAHPEYALILINNRDEFLTRPTAPANWWVSPNDNVLGGRDLQRKEQGTWLGITKQGRIAVLTNFREEGAIKPEARSRGAMVNAFLTQPPQSSNGTEKFVHDLVEDEGLKGVGGFILVCGRVGEPLAVISNRTPNVEDTTWIAKDKGETIGLSNAALGNRSWPKVIRGEALLSSAIKQNLSEQKSQASFTKHLFHILGDDTLPRRPKDYSWDSSVQELRKSIFIPAIGGEGAERSRAEDLAAAKSDQHVNVENGTKAAVTKHDLDGVYGTQKQTVVLVDRRGRVTFMERTLYDATSKATVAPDRDRAFQFDIEGWKDP